MPVLVIPSPMRSLTGGESRVTVEGATLREAIRSLEAAYPGTAARLTVDDRLQPGLAVWVDGELPTTGLNTRLAPDSEVYFAPALAGG